MKKLNYSPDHDEETTARHTWWALKFPDGTIYGEVINEESDKGFDLKLYATREIAERKAVEMVEGTDYQRAFPLKVCIAQLDSTFRG